MANKRIYLCLAHMSGLEQKYIQEAFDTNWVVPLGPNVNAFEEDLKNFVGQNREVVALSAGTAAIHLALIACGVQPGDEVCVQSFTFCASSHPIKYLGATPVFIDSEKDTWNMDPALLEEAINDRIAKTGKKPKAIIPVALYGMPYQIDKIMEIAERYDIPVIEDAAEGFGSRYDGKVLGTFGRFGVLSFNGNKMITTSGGGALICNGFSVPEVSEVSKVSEVSEVSKVSEVSEVSKVSESETIETLKPLKQIETPLEVKNKIMWYATQAREAYPYYQHEAIGYNYRLSNICAGIGRGQMTVANEHIEHHRHIAELYRKAFEDIEGVAFHDEPKPHPQFGTDNQPHPQFGTDNQPHPQFGTDNQPHPQPLSVGEGSVVENKRIPSPLSSGGGSGVRPLPWQTANLSVYKNLKEFVRANRKNFTEAENALWQALRNRKLNFKFHRQHVIDGFIVDFVCLENNLTIEVDGGYHNDKEQAEYDRYRTQLLNELGYTELRFTNDEVLNNMESVLASIKQELSNPQQSNSPSPSERGWGEANSPSPLERGWGEAEYFSNFWLCTITLDPNLKIKGQENAYGKAITGAVGGAAGVVHQAASLTTDCQPNDNVEALRVYLDAAGIEARPLWKPMHKQPVYQGCPAYLNGVSEELFKKGMCLPSGPCVTDDDVYYVVDCIKKAIEK